MGAGIKTFTVVVVAQLSREGRIRLDDPTIKYVPESPSFGQRRMATGQRFEFRNFLREGLTLVNNSNQGIGACQELRELILVLIGATR